MRIRTGGALVSLAAVLLAGCAEKARIYSTWASLGERPGRTRPALIAEVPPSLPPPWAGTVSHHLLTDELIDRWFAELAARRKVERFYILSPSHWGLSTAEFSVTDGSWRTASGFVASDRGEARAIAARLGVELEPSVFDPEHGVSTLIPYIANHFPRAKVVALAYRGEPPVDQPMAERLAAALAPAFRPEKRNENFLIVSTDFSHHGNRGTTDARDGRSNVFFDAPAPSNWILVGCDNRPGIYALSKLLGPAARSIVLCHTDSFELTGLGQEDITSYFFSFFW